MISYVPCFHCGLDVSTLQPGSKIEIWARTTMPPLSPPPTTSQRPPQLSIKSSQREEQRRRESTLKSNVIRANHEKYFTCRAIYQAIRTRPETMFKSNAGVPQNIFVLVCVAQRPHAQDLNWECGLPLPKPIHHGQNWRKLSN